MKKIYSILKATALVMLMSIAATHNTQAQCSVVSQGGATDPTCSYLNVSGGAGAYWTLNVVSGVNYSFYWGGSSCSDNTAFCVNGTTSTASSSAAPYTATAATNSWNIGFYEANTTWCGTSATLNYRITQPTATAGGITSATVCASTNSYTVPAGYSSTVGSVSWSASSTAGAAGTITNGTTLTPTYNFTNADKTSGATVTLTMTVDNGGCTATASFTLTIVAAPVATQGGTSSASVCGTAGSYAVPPGYSATNGTISWTASSSSGVTGSLSGATTTTPTYNFTPQDVASGATVILTMNVTNATCGSVSTTFTLSIKATPTATQGATHIATVCATPSSYTIPAGYSSTNGTITWTAVSSSGTNGTITNGSTLTPTYNFSPADVTNGATVTLTMTVANSPCTSASTTFTLTINPAPTATQGVTSTGTVCATAGTYTVPAGYASTNGAITWTASSTSGTAGFITNGNTLTPTYNFSAADITSGATVTLTMSVANSPCTSATTTFTLTVTPAPIASAGPTTTGGACVTDGSYTVPSGYTATYGTINWTASSSSGTTGTVTNPTSTTPTYNFSASDVASGATVILTMTVSDGGTCTPTSTNFTLTINQPPTATQGATTAATVCGSSNFYTLPAGYSAANGTVSWTASSTSGSNGFISNPTTLTPTYNFSAADIASGATVTLTMTVSDGGSCAPATTSFTLTIDALPSATAGPTTSATVCANSNTYTVPSGYASANGTINWTASSTSGTAGTFTNGNTLTPTYNFSPADIASGGTVTLTMTVSDGGVCPSATATFTLTLTPLPVATPAASTSSQVCANANFYTIPAGYSASNGTVTWTASSTSGTTGFITNPNTLTPTYNFSTDDISSGATVTMTMTVDDGGICPAATTTYEIDILALPAAITGATTSAAVCASQASYTVPAGYGAANGGITWTASSTAATTGTLTNANTQTPTYTFSPDDTTTGATVTLTMTVDDGGVCPSSSTSFTLTIYQNPTPASAGPLQNICGSFISGPLGGNTPTIGSGTWSQFAGPGVTFFSSPNAGNSTASVTAPGLYIFAWTTATGGGQCTSVAYDSVNFYASPTTATVGPTQNVCGSLTSAPLGGNNASVGIGTWSQTSGPGTTTFSYPDSGISTATVTALGSYTYTWTISNGTCVPSSASVVVNFIASPSGGAIADLAYCSSVGTGTVSVTGVSSANQYAWALPAGLSGSSGTSAITVGGTVPGVYTVTVTPQDVAFGVTCSGTPITGTVKILAPPTVDSVLSRNVSCFGGTNDTIAIFATTANGNLQYSINGGTTYPNTTGVFTGLAPGNYNIYVKDDSSCSTAYGANPVVMTSPSTLLSAASVTTPVGCTGESNGSINLLASGGVGGYIYKWSSGQNIQIISGLPAGIYTGSVTDANGCVATVTDTLINPSPIVTTITGTDVTCYGSGNGRATISITGGVGPYAILWSNFDTTASVRRLPAGIIRVRVTDSYGCEHSDSIRIRRPALLTGTLSVTNVACFGSNIDSIVVDATGGNAGGYTYTWSPSVSTTNAVTNVTPGQYNVTVTDTKGCTFTDSATITQPLTALTISSVVNDMTCHNANDGKITILTSGGVGGYTFSWATGQTTSVISGLSAGTYAVTVTDANGCTAGLSTVINNPALITSSVTGTNISCAGGATGSATLNVSGGTAGYSFLWSNFDTSQNLSNVVAGLYRVIIKDANGCQHYDSVIITQPQPLAAVVTVRNVNCSGGNTGSVLVTVTGGTPGVNGYTYSWSPVASSTDSVSGVGPGTYTVVATDSLGCNITASGTVLQLASTLSANAIVTDMTCNNANNGEITVLPSGGAGGYTYAWASGQNTSTITGLAAGPYTVTVRDNNGCTVSLSDTIHNPAAITSSIVGTNVTCAGASNGAAALSVTGGTGAFTYLWSNFDTTKNIANIAGGLYRVIITDANGCRHYDSIVIAEPLPISISIAVRNVSCFGAANGSVIASVSGGTPGVGGYTYSWSPVASATDSVSGVGPGTYTVVVTDSHSCQVRDSGTVTQPATAVSVLSNVVNVSCGGNSDGSITLSVNGGTPGYTYAWATGQHTQNITNLAAGIYTVTVQDVSGCSVVVSDTVKAPTPITSSIVGTNVTCAGADNGTATLTVGGGTLPYNFLWSNFSGAQNQDSLSAGWYYVIITDGYGCQKRDSVKILSPLPLLLSDTVAPVSCTNGTNGGIHIIATGGTGAYTYTWSPSGPNSPDNTNLSAGSYSVTVRDVNGCSATLTQQIANPAALTSTYTTVEPKCFGDRNGSITVVVGGGTPQYSYTWSPSAANSPVNSFLTAGTYQVTATDSRGCTIVDTIVVNQPPAMYISGILKNVSCHGLSDGYILPTGYGGTLPYSYQWYLGTDTFAPQGPITENITQLPGGDYYLVITDANGCMAPFTRHVVEPDSLILTLTDTNVTCYGTSTGSVLAHVTGGTTPYQYLWNNFTTDSIQRGVPAGTYTVVVTDSNGCHQNKAISVTQAPALVVSAADVDPTCYGSSNGSITLTVSGGNPAYTYSWNTTPAQTTPSISGLTAGTYIVNIADGNRCHQIDTFVLTSPSAMTVNTAITNPTCAGGDNGFVSLDVRGGVSPYLYSWSTTPAQSGNVANALSGGTYYATVTDAHGCTLLDTAVVVSPLPILVTIGVNSSTCPGNAVGIVVVNATGGIAPYNYSLGSLTQTSDTFINLQAGNYSAVVTDVNGCHGDAPLVVGVAGAFTDTLTASPSVILAGEIVQLYARASSDTTITSYTWYPADSLDFSACGNASVCDSPTARPTQSQDYIVLVTNARGCTLRDTVHVSVSNQPSAFIPQGFTPNNDGLNDRFQFDILGATTVSVQIWNRWGELVFSDPSQPNGINQSGTYGWDGTFRGQQAAFDTYTYQFDVTYFDGHHQTMAGTVTVMR